MSIDYSRNYLYIEEELQKKIGTETTIIIIGAGIGSYIAEGLLRIGFKQIIIADGDYVEASNLNRQNYTAGDYDNIKTIALYERLRKIDFNNSISYIPFHLSDKETLRKWIIQADIVLNTIDLDSDAFIDCNLIAKDLDKVVLFPLNLGFACGLYIFYPHTKTFNEYFYESVDMKQAILQHTFQTIVRKQQMPVWLSEAIAKYQSAPHKKYDPQMIPGNLSLTSLAVSSCLALCKGEKLKEFPNLIFYDSYHQVLDSGYDVLDRGKVKSICLYHINKDLSVWELGEDRMDDFIDFVWKVYKETYPTGEWPFTKKDKQQMLEEEQYYHPVSRVFAVLGSNERILGTSRSICTQLNDRYEIPLTKEFGITKKDLYNRFKVDDMTSSIYDTGRSAVDKNGIKNVSGNKSAKYDIFTHIAKQLITDACRNENNIIVGEPSLIFHKIIESSGVQLPALAKEKNYLGIKCIPAGNRIKNIQDHIRDNFSSLYGFFFNSLM